MLTQNISPVILFADVVSRCTCSLYCKSSRCGPFEAEHPKRNPNRYFREVSIEYRKTKTNVITLANH